MKGRNTFVVLALALGFFGLFFMFDHRSVTQTNQSATVLAVRQIETALEFYYIEHGHYPQVESAELIETLKADGQLQQSFPDVAVTYRVRAEGADYELTQ